MFFRYVQNHRGKKEPSSIKESSSPIESHLQHYGKLNSSQSTWLTQFDSQVVTGEEICNLLDLCSSGGGDASFMEPLTPSEISKFLANAAAITTPTRNYSTKVRRNQQLFGGEEVVSPILPSEFPKLHMKLHRATNVAAPEVFTVTRDPFIVVRLGDQCMTSCVKYDTLEPIWEEDFQFDLMDISDKLMVTLCDFDIDNEPSQLGTVAIDLPKQPYRPHNVEASIGDAGIVHFVIMTTDPDDDLKGGGSYPIFGTTIGSNSVCTSDA